MEKRIYIGTIHKDKGSDFGVSFFDFPGCTSAGKDLAEAKGNAQEALQGHIDVMVEGGDLISDPSSPTESYADDTAVAFVPIEVMVPEGAVKRINITARASDLAVIDAYLRKSGRSRDRSDFLIKSALDHVQSEKYGVDAVGRKGGLSAARRMRGDMLVRDLPRPYEGSTMRKPKSKKRKKEPV